MQFESPRQSEPAEERRWAGLFLGLKPPGSLLACSHAQGWELRLAVGFEKLLPLLCVREGPSPLWAVGLFSFLFGLFDIPWMEDGLAKKYCWQAIPQDWTTELLSPGEQWKR